MSIQINKVMIASYSLTRVFRFGCRVLNWILRVPLET